MSHSEAIDIVVAVIGQAVLIGFFVSLAYAFFGKG